MIARTASGTELCARPVPPDSAPPATAPPVASAPAARCRRRRESRTGAGAEAVRSVQVMSRSPLVSPHPPPALVPRPGASAAAILRAAPGAVHEHYKTKATPKRIEWLL